MDQRIVGFNRCNVSTSEGDIIGENGFTGTRSIAPRRRWRCGWASRRAARYATITNLIRFPRKSFTRCTFFHSAADPAMDGNKKDTPPILRVRPGDKEKLAALEKPIAAMEERVSEAATKVAYIDPAELDVAQAYSKETVWIEDGFPPKQPVKATRNGKL